MVSVRALIGVWMLALIAAAGAAQAAEPAVERGLVVAQKPPPPRPPAAAPTIPKGKSCRREPIWGFRMSPFCKPTGICSDRVIKGYRTVCS
jgi:hypothetical protein